MTSGYFAKLPETFTGSVRTTVHQQEINAEQDEAAVDDGFPTCPLLRADGLSALEDFTRNDAQDTIFEEYDSPVPTRTPFDWKLSRPSLSKCVARSSWVALQLIFWGGLAIGAYGIIAFYLDINIGDLCHWVPFQQLGRLRQGIRLAGVAFKVFWIEFWQFLILLTIFKWPLLKELNLLAINLLGAFMDVSYRLLLYIFDANKPPWVPYPLNVLFCCLVVYNSYAVAKRICPPNANRRAATLKLTFKLCCQLVLGLPTGLFLNYFAFTSFARTPPGLQRAVIAVVVPLVAIPCEVVSRLCAIHLEGINHPGTSHALVVGAYGTFTIVFRTLQANIERFELFIGLSIARGVVYIAERMTAPMRDYYLNNMLLWSLSCCCGRCYRRRQTSIVRSPRSQRLTADMSIQGMIFETMSVVYSIVVVYIYYMAYGIDENKGVVFRVEITRRIPVALAVEFVINSVVILFQTRYMNIPVMRVWKRNWKKHLAIAMITTTMTLFYFTKYQLHLIRAVFLNENGTLPLVGNCTRPFH